MLTFPTRRSSDLVVAVGGSERGDSEAPPKCLRVREVRYQTGGLLLRCDPGPEGQERDDLGPFQADAVGGHHGASVTREVVEVPAPLIPHAGADEIEIGRAGKRE